MSEIDTKRNKNKTLKEVYAERLRSCVRIAKFNGTVIIESAGQWRDMGSDLFAQACYEEFGDSISKSMIVDLEHLFRNTASDFSSRSHLILFDESVWNSKEVDWDHSSLGEDCIYGIGYTPHEPEEKIQFIMDLANGDPGVYDDIMQSVAPILLDRKPTGVIWYLGSGSNGKSSLVHLLYMIFGEYLTEITVKQLEDERDAPQLNGKLGNICKESSEAFIKDTRTYKSIGTHETFMVHKFHSQEMTRVSGNVHHIFSANNIPTFSDKSDGAKRRTLIIPFTNRFESDETFEDRTFTKDFIESFLGEMVKYARLIKSRGYRYEFSEASMNVKKQYDMDSNTSLTYALEIIAEGIHGFNNFRNLYTDYEIWCQESGYRPSNVAVLRRAIKEKGFIRKTRRMQNDITEKIYTLGDINTARLVKLSDMRPGLFKYSEIVNDGEDEEKLL